MPTRTQKKTRKSRETYVIWYRKPWYKSESSNFGRRPIVLVTTLQWIRTLILTLIFFRIFFFEIFFLKGSPLHFFDVLRQNGCWKIPKGSSFQFFSALWDFIPKIKKKFSSIFSCFATEWMLKNLKRSPLSVFRHCETLARQGLAVASTGAPLGPFF